MFPKRREAMAFIGIDRAIESHWIYQDPEYFKVWFEILLRTRYGKETDKKLVQGELITIEYGHFVFGRIGWSDRLKVSERRIRTLFEKLIKDEMIELVSKYRKCTVYKVVNFAKYHVKNDQQSDQQPDQAQQGEEGYSGQQTDHPATSERPADDQRATTQEQSKQRNKANKVNKEIIYSPDFEVFWNCYPKQIGKPAAFNNWNKLIKTINPDYLKACASNYASYVIANNTEIQFIKQPNNFLNAKEEYYKQFESPVLIHNRGGQPRGKPSSTERLQELFKQAEEDERREANGGY
jgi:hypothetical protein